MQYPIAFTQKPFVISTAKWDYGCLLAVRDENIKKESLAYGVLFVGSSGDFYGARFLLIGF